MLIFFILKYLFNQTKRTHSQAKFGLQDACGHLLSSLSFPYSPSLKQHLRRREFKKFDRELGNENGKSDSSESMVPRSELLGRASVDGG